MAYTLVPPPGSKPSPQAIVAIASLMASTPHSTPSSLADPPDDYKNNSDGDHTSSAPIPLSNQVGGHPGVMSSSDGALVIKPCLAQEKEFYNALAQAQAAELSPEYDDSSPGSSFRALGPWVPKFYGTLRLEGKVASAPAGEGSEAHAGPTQEVILDVEGAGEKVLENISYPFHRPNVLDVKLGTILYEPSASPEKKVHMEQTARETTSLETGIRLTGFQVYNSRDKTFTTTPKSYGKSIKASDLPAGVARFFPVSTEEDRTGVSAALLLRVLEGILGQVRQVGKAIEATEMRMVGGSILIVWEGDEELLEAALDKRDKEPPPSEATEGEESEESSGASSGLEDVSASGGEDHTRATVVGPPFVVRVIDFAHTHAVPGEGPDLGVLKGVHTIISLLEGRIEEVKKLL